MPQDFFDNLLYYDCSSVPQFLSLNMNGKPWKNNLLRTLLTLANLFDHLAWILVLTTAMDLMFAIKSSELVVSRRIDR